MSLKINEIFCSIQGESLFAGLACAFIRLSGCNLRCSYCDTGYAYDEGSYLGIDEILEKVDALGCDLVELTGGEPLFQEKTPELAESLLRKGFRVLVETNGSFNVGVLNRECIKIVDIKCPDSHEANKMDLANLSLLGERDQVKFVISSIMDFQWAEHFIQRYCSHIFYENILLSPVSGKVAPAELARWMLENRLKARLQLQLHKIIWPEKNRGV